MRLFKQGSWNKEMENVCPICKTQNKGEVVLIPIMGKQEGFDCEALQVHLDCLDLWIDLEGKIIYQKIGKEN